MSLNKSIFLFIIIIFSSFYAAAFTKTGNIFIKPFIEDKISSEIKYRIEITHLDSKPGKIYIEGISPESNNIKIKVLGEYSFLKGVFVLEAYNNNEKLVKNYKY